MRALQGRRSARGGERVGMHLRGRSVPLAHYRRLWGTLDGGTASGGLLTPARRAYAGQSAHLLLALLLAGLVPSDPLAAQAESST